MKTGLFILIISIIILYILILLFTYTTQNPSSIYRTYFEKLYPISDWSAYNNNQLQSLYLSLFIYYTDIIPDVKDQIITRAPSWDEVPFIYSQIPHGMRLFDSTVCDCLRATFDDCLPFTTRHRDPWILAKCPIWSGVYISQSYDYMLRIAKDSNNTEDNYYPKDTPKGFPSGSWVEGVTFPGEYGHPYICDNLLTEHQPGIYHNNKPLIIPKSESPYWMEPCTGVCKSAQDTCIYIQTDGTFPRIGSRSGRYCINKKFVTPREEFSTQRPENYHGLWLYPLAGGGMWRNLGKTLVSNTKLGFFLQPRPYGAQFRLRDLLKYTHGAAQPTNLNYQFEKIKEILSTGKTSRPFPEPECSLDELKQHSTYTGDILTDESIIEDIAEQILTDWYVHGYCGLTDKTINNGHGFNYNYTSYFPIGVYFSYGIGLDILLLNILTELKIDTIQFVLEPQHSVGSMRPAYFFEIFAVQPTQPNDWSVYKDTSYRGCQDWYICDPTNDLDNFMQYGYLRSDKVTNITQFSTTLMTLTPDTISFPLN